MKKKHPFLYVVLRRAIVLILLLLMILTAYHQSTGQLISPEGFFTGIITPVQRIVSKAEQAFSEYLYRVKLRSNIEYEYNQLKAQNDELVTDRVAEQLKLDLADVRTSASMEHIAVVRGRDIATGMPLTVDVNMSKVSEAIREPLREILAAIKWVLGRIPPEFAVDILKNGLFLTGGSAALPNLDTMIASEFGVPVSVARDAGECTTLGAGYMADHFDMLGNQDKRNG